MTLRSTAAIRSKRQCWACSRIIGSRESTSLTVPSKRDRAKLSSSGSVLCKRRKVAITCWGVCSPSSHWKSICKASSRAFLREAIQESCPLLTNKRRRPLLEESAGSFLHVGRRAAKSEQSGFEELPLRLRHFHAVIHGFHGKLHRQRAVGHDFARHGFGCSDQIFRGHNLIHQSDSVGLLGGDRLSGENQFHRSTLAHQTRQSLRPGITGDDPQLDFRLTKTSVLRGDTQRACHRQLAAAAQ